MPKSISVDRSRAVTRHTFVRDGVTLSYVDYSGAGAPIIALHAYWMEASTYADLAQARGAQSKQSPRHGDRRIASS